MKATRRQELRTNELAQTLLDLGDFLRNRSNYVIGAVVVVGVVVLIWYYLQYTSGRDWLEATREARTLPYDTDADVRSSVNRLKELIAKVDEEQFLAEALQGWASMAMRRAHASEDGTPSAEFLDSAADAYQQILARLPHRRLEKGASLLGLATIEADRFVLDRDPSRQAKAREYLERVRDAEEFNGTPLKSLALDQLNELDNVFVVVALAEPLPPALTPLPPTGPILPPVGTPAQLDSFGRAPVPDDGRTESADHPEAPGFKVRQTGVEVIPVAAEDVPPKATQVAPPQDDESEEMSLAEPAETDQDEAPEEPD